MWEIEIVLSPEWRQRHGLEPKPAPAPKTRVCTKCAQTKPLIELFWNIDPRSCEGFRRECKACAAKRVQRTNRKNASWNKQLTLEKELAESRLTAAIELLKEFPELIDTIADKDFLRFKTKLKQVRNNILVRMEERMVAQKAIAQKSKATMMARKAARRALESQQCTSQEDTQTPSAALTG